jgi:transmembrane sensor
LFSRLRSSTRTRGLGAAAVVLIAVLGAGYAEIDKIFVPPNVSSAIKTTHPGGIMAALAGPTTYSTGRGENRSIDLSDGSRVDLGAASTISVDFAPEVRRVTLLTGEALFHVSKDPSRPFVVDSGGGETQAIGTVFDVHRQLEDVTVSVIEGIVRVQSELPASASTRLMAGHEVSYSMSGKIGAVKAASLPTTASWRDGELAFVDRKLSDVVADLNRYSSKPIVLADDDLKALRITGMVQVNQMQGWLRALEKNMPVRVHATADEIVLLNRPPLQPAK